MVSILTGPLRPVTNRAPGFLGLAFGSWHSMPPSRYLLRSLARMENYASRHAILSASKGRISSQKGKINIPSWEGCRVSGGVGMPASPIGVLNALRHLIGRHPGNNSPSQPESPDVLNALRHLIGRHSTKVDQSYSNLTCAQRLTASDRSSHARCLVSPLVQGVLNALRHLIGRHLMTMARTRIHWSVLNALRHLIGRHP